MLNQKQLNELSEEISVFQENPVLINWYSKTNKSTALISFDYLDINCDSGYIYIGENYDNPSLYIDIVGVRRFVKEMDRLRIETTDIDYIIEIA